VIRNLFVESFLPNYSDANSRDKAATTTTSPPQTSSRNPRQSWQRSMYPVDMHKEHSRSYYSETAAPIFLNRTTSHLSGDRTTIASPLSSDHNQPEEDSEADVDNENVQAIGNWRRRM
jgi:hypothetical protein